MKQLLHVVPPIIAIIVLWSATRVAGQPDRTIAAADARADAALARRALELIHPGLDRYSPRAEFAAAFDALDRLCEHDVSERVFYRTLSTALAQLRCSHTKAEPSPGWVEWRKTQPTYLPFRFIVHDGRMIVTRPACAELTPGDEVVALHGIPAGVVLATLLAAVPADGWTDDARRFALASSSDLDESELDHFLPAYFELPPRVRLEVRTPGAPASRNVTVALLTAEARRAALREPSAARNLDEAVSLELLAGGVAVLRVGTFVAYRKPIKPADIYRPLFERLAAENVATLILDVRDNGGGSDEAAIDLTRFLITQPFVSTTRSWVRTYRFGDLADKLETWDRSLLNLPDERFRKLENGCFELQHSAPQTLDPLEPTFKGRLIALCGPANASGATLFLSGLRARRPVTLLGEPTGGSIEGPTAGVIFFLPLPNTGIRVRIPALRTATGLPATGVGLEPDILIRPALADVLADRDALRQRAVEYARENR